MSNVTHQRAWEMLEWFSVLVDHSVLAWHVFGRMPPKIIRRFSGSPQNAIQASTARPNVAFQPDIKASVLAFASGQPLRGLCVAGEQSAVAFSNFTEKRTL